MQINSIIIDDEPNNIENIQSILQKLYPEISVVATATDAVEGIATINQLQPDLVFLDVQMPVLDGARIRAEHVLRIARARAGAGDPEWKRGERQAQGGSRGDAHQLIG